MFCKHEKETHWVNGFFGRGWDTKITTCKKCRKIFSTKKIKISTAYPKVKKEAFIEEAEKLEREIHIQDYCLDMMYEEIYKHLSSNEAKENYIRFNNIDFSMDPTPSLCEYMKRMQRIGADWAVGPKREITEFINSIGGWQIKSIVFYQSGRVEITLV